MRVELDDNSVIDLGITETTPTISIADFSRRVTDEFGVTTVVERGFSRRMSVRGMLDTGDVDAVYRRLAELRATSALWVADDAIASLQVRGFYRDFSIDIPGEAASFCTLSIEGLTETAPVADPSGDPAPAGAASTLQLLLPQAITDAVLTASSVLETEYPAWGAGTTYGQGARVLRAHRVWESLDAGNIGHDPIAAPEHWLDLAPTNRWAMFDQALGTVTTGTSQIVVTLTPAAAVDGLAILDTDAGVIRVQAPGYDRTLLRGGDHPEPAAVVLTDLVVAAGAAITVTLGAPGGASTPRTWNDAATWFDAARWQDADVAPGPGPVQVGTLLIGHVVGLGITEASPTASITDFSRKEVDEFGDATIVERAWAKRLSARALIRSDAVDVVFNRLTAVRARPSLWVGQEGLDSLTVYGFFKEFSIEIGEGVSTLSLSIEGLSKAAPIIDPAADLKKLRADLDKTEADLAALASDNVLSHGQEKATLVRDYAILYNTFQSLDARYQALNSPADVTTARNVAFARRGDLDALLLSYAPAWNELATDTAVNGTTLRATWTQAANAIAAFAAAITGRVGPQGPAGEDGITNLIDISGWVPGQPIPARFTPVEYPAGESAIVLDIGPSGVSEPMWRAVSAENVYDDNPGAPDGGFTYTLDPSEFDVRKSYRFMQWMRQEGDRAPGHGGLYLGTQQAGGDIRELSGATNSNPYFWNDNLPTDNEWYLVVGIVHGAGYAGGQSGVSGVYSPKTGQRVLPGTDFKQNPAGTNLTFRAFQYYRSTGAEARFARPSMEEISQSTFSVEQLFATVGMTAGQATAFSIAQGRITALTSDDIVAAYAEKQALIQSYDELAALRTAADTESLNLSSIYGGDPTGTERVTQANAATALSVYLSNLAPAWFNVTVDTPVNGATLRQLFTAAYTATANLIAANSAFIRNRTKAAQDRVFAIGADSVLSAGQEKSDLIIDYTGLANDFAALDARYVALGSPADITASRDNASLAKTALDNLLLSYNPAWNNIAVDTVIPDAGDYRTKWTTAEQKLSVFAAAITGRKGDKGDPGASALSGYLTNEHANVASDPSGVVTSYVGADTVFKVLAADGTDLTDSGYFVLSIVANPQALSINVSGRYFAVSGGFDPSEDAATVTARVTGSGPYNGITYDKVFSLTKSKSGGIGQDAKDISVAASSQLVRYDKDGIFAGQAITFTSTRKNTSAQTLWQILNPDGSTTGWGPAYSSSFAQTPSYFTTTSGDDLTMTAAGVHAFLGGSGRTSVVIRVRIDGDPTIYDTVTIGSVRDGAKGDRGDSAPLTIVQWSIDGVSNWHSNYFGADQYQRQSVDGGNTFGPAYKVIGEAGQVGTDGTSPSTVFRRSATVPAAPLDNSGNPPAGWYDGPPGGTDFIWQSNARFRGATQLTSWSAPQRISAADGAPGLSFDINIAAAEVSAGPDGTVKDGQLPIEIAVKVLSGGNDVTNAASITVAPANGISASYAAKIVSITAVAASGEVVISATYGGTPLGSKRITITKRLDSASGSSSSSAGPLSVAIPSNGGSIAYNDAVGAPVLTLTPNAAGVIQCDAKLTYASPSQKVGNQPIRAGDFTPAARFQYRENGTSTWLPVGGEVTGSQAVFYTNDNDPDQNDVHGGELTISQQATGLDPVKQYDLRLQPRRVTSTPMSATTNVAGNQAFARP